MCADQPLQRQEASDSSSSDSSASAASALAGFMRQSLQLSGGSNMAVAVLWLDDRYKLCLRMGSIRTATLRQWESAHKQLTRRARTDNTSTRLSGAQPTDASAKADASTRGAAPAGTSTETTPGSGAGAAARADTFQLVARVKGRQVTVDPGVEAAAAAVVHAAQQVAALTQEQILIVSKGARIAAQEVHDMVQQDLKQNAFAVMTCAAVRVDSPGSAEPETLAARSERSSTHAGGAVLELMAAAGEVGGSWVLVCSAPPAMCTCSGTAVAAVVHGISGAASSSSTAFAADHTGRRLQVAVFCAAAVHEQADSFLQLPVECSASITFNETAPPRSRSAVLALSLDTLVLASGPDESPLCRLSAQRRLQQLGSCPRPMEAVRRATTAAAAEVATLLLVGPEELSAVVQPDAGDEETAALMQRLAEQSMPLSVQDRRGNTQLHDAKHISMRVVPDGAALIGLQRRRGAVSKDGKVMTLTANQAVTASAFTEVDRSQRSRAHVKARRAAAKQQRNQKRLGYTPLANLRDCTAPALAQQLHYLQMAEAFAYEELRQDQQCATSTAAAAKDAGAYRANMMACLVQLQPCVCPLCLSRFQGCWCSARTILCGQLLL